MASKPSCLGDVTWCQMREFREKKIEQWFLDAGAPYTLTVLSPGDCVQVYRAAKQE